MQARAQNIDGNLTLVIPLGAGGDELLEPSRGIGKVDGKDLKIVIPYWLADKLGLDDGGLVELDYEHGALNVTAVEAPLPHPLRN